MPYVRLFPNGTVSNDIPTSGMSGGGSIPAHTILGDGSLYTYMRQVHSGIGTLTRLNMGTYALQTNERIVALRIGMIKAHTHALGVYAQLNGHVDMGAGTWSRVPFFDITKPRYAPVYYGPWIYKNEANNSDWDQTELDALQLYVRWLNPGGTFDARLYEIWVDVFVRAQPVPTAVHPAIGAVVQNDKPRFQWALPFEDGIPYQQYQYSLKVFTKAVVEGVGFDPDTSTAVATVPLWQTSQLVSGPWGPPSLNNPALIWGDRYYWVVKSWTKMPGGNPPFISEWSDPAPFKITAKPFADITEPTGIITTNLPLIKWYNADTEQDPLKAWEIRVYERPGASWVGFDPDTTLLAPIARHTGTDRSQFELQMITPVRDNKVYRTYIKVAQGTFQTLQWGHGAYNRGPYYYIQPGPLLWGPWGYEEFTTDFVEPNAPTLAATSFEDHVRIDVTPGIEPIDIDYYVIERSFDGGETWETFRTGIGEGTTAVLEDETVLFSVEDHEIPNYEEVEYRGYSVSTDLGPGFEMASAYSNVVTGEVGNDNIWLKDTGDYNNNAHFPYQDEWVSRSTNRVRGIHAPLGRSKHIVVRGQNNSESFTLNLLVIGAEKKAKLDGIIQANRTLYMTTPKGSWYVDISGPVSWQDRMGDARQGEEDVWRCQINLIEVEGTDV